MTDGQGTARVTTVRVGIRVQGRVQGVGYRPFVWRLATGLGLSGWVGNDAAGVVLEAEGTAADVDRLARALRDAAPPLARVDDVRCTAIPAVGGAGFAVRASDADGPAGALVPPDTATCPACLAELRDPGDRRHDHAFVSCTDCGPRWTIARAMPWDRARTTMDRFPLCAECAADYADPADRRFHAEQVCCPACGPRLELVGPDGEAPAGVAGDDPVAGAVALLRAGAVVALKGLGGYHLAADARREEVLAGLRARKHRPHRPFAVMVADLPAARRICRIDAVEESLLTGPERPVVVLRRLPGDGLADAVAPGAPTTGVMLPYTPLHALLLDRFGGPLVMTSGNLSDEPIVHDDAQAHRLAPLCDAVLRHDRPIHVRADDSVVRVVRGRAVPLRRSRGYVPTGVPLPLPPGPPVLGCGPALKNTFCLTRGAEAFPSPHVGDLGDWATFRSWVEGVGHLSALLGVRPQVLAHDLHPDYPSTRWALEQEGVGLVAVQHHHAHIASCLADNGRCGPVIGVAFDGLGLGSDGTAWGGEWLVADLVGFRRVAHLAAVPMPGGDAATRQPWRMAAAHVDAAYDGSPPAGLPVARRHGRRWDEVLSVARSGVNAPPTSSAGRLFDAAAALLGIRDEVTYEGQAAIELEHAADPAETGAWRVPAVPPVTPVTPVGGQPQVVPVGELVRALVDDQHAGTPVPVIAARVHNTLARVVADVCRTLRDAGAPDTVALSGGVWQNALLLERTVDLLEDAGFEVLLHRQVPPNDGGVSLGQAAVATAQLLASSVRQPSAASVASHST